MSEDSKDSEGKKLGSIKVCVQAWPKDYAEPSDVEAVDKIKKNLKDKLEQVAEGEGTSDEKVAAINEEMDKVKESVPASKVKAIQAVVDVSEDEDEADGDQRLYDRKVKPSG